MTEKEKTDAILRIVSNRCRNLRKLIDRARTLQTAEQKGQVLNEEQRESVRGIQRKEAMLAELQEILKKQTAVIDPPPPQEPKLSRRAQKAARAKAREAEEKAKAASVPATSEKGSVESEQVDGSANVDKDKIVEHSNVTNGHDPVNGAVSIDSNGLNDNTQPGTPSTKKQNLSNDLPLSEHLTPQQQTPQQQTPQQQSTPAIQSPLILPPESIAMGAQEREVLLREMADLKLNHEHQLHHTRADVVRNLLNFCHVAEFLRQPGSREALLNYYDTPEGRASSLNIKNVHLALISYFHVMLTSPNGDVSHPEAVEVSTAHCLGYLQGSTEDAFQGTPYSYLVEIVNTLSICPILTNRGVISENRNGTQLYMRGSQKSRMAMAGTVGAGEPGHVVQDPVTSPGHP